MGQNQVRGNDSRVPGLLDHDISGERVQTDIRTPDPDKKLFAAWSFTLRFGLVDGW